MSQMGQNRKCARVTRMSVLLPSTDMLTGFAAIKPNAFLSGLSGPVIG